MASPKDQWEFRNFSLPNVDGVGYSGHHVIPIETLQDSRALQAKQAWDALLAGDDMIGKSRYRASVPAFALGVSMAPIQAAPRHDPWVASFLSCMRDTKYTRDIHAC